MATPTGVTKRLYAAGLRKGATWGTAVAVGANNEILPTDDSGLQKNQKYESYPAIDQIIPMDGALGVNEPPEFAPPVALQYEMGPIAQLLAALYGTAGAPSNVETGVWKHTFQMNNEVTHFFTYVEERPGHIWEVPSAMPIKASIKLDGANIAAEITLRGNTLTANSAVNTPTQVDALTPVNRATFIRFTEGQFLMNAQGGGALSANNDTLEISDFGMDLTRGLDSVHIAGNINIAQPKEGPAPQFSIRLVIPHANNASVDYLATFENRTAQKMKISFTGTSIGNNSNYQLSFYFPRVRLSEAPVSKLADIIQTELNFIVEEAANSPTGMNYARPYIELTNTSNADYLG